MSIIAQIPCTATAGCANTSPSPPVLQASQNSAACGMSEMMPKSASWGGARANSGGARSGAGRPPAERIIQRTPLGLRWYVLILAGRNPKEVLRDLLEGETRPGYAPRPEFGGYLPTQAVERMRLGRVARGADGKIVLDHRPCYGPGYAFAEFDRDTDPWGTIGHVDGVQRILGTRSGIPIPLPPDWHEGERKQEPERMRLPDVALDVLAPGSAVRIVRGALTDHLAVVEEDSGLTTRIIVQVFGEQRPVLVRRDWIEDVS